MGTADPLQLFALAFTQAKHPFLRPTDTHHIRSPSENESSACFDLM
jgi:hypothetical protein